MIVERNFGFIAAYKFEPVLTTVPVEFRPEFHKTLCLGLAFKFYPGLNLSYRFLGDWKVYASYNSSLRMPTFTELYYSVGGHQADKNLKAEKMQSVEGGLKFSRPWLNAVLTVYYNMGRNMIDWTKDLSEGANAEWRSGNYTRVNAFGQELSARVDFPEYLRLSTLFTSAYIL